MSQSNTTKSLKQLLAWLTGPAIVMVVGIMGAGSTVSLLSSGCYFQYALLWAIPFSLPAIIVAQDTASRIGAAASIGTMQLIDRETMAGVKWIVLIPMLVGAVFVNMGQLGAMVASLSNLINVGMGNELISANPSVRANLILYTAMAIVVVVINATGGYKRIEKMFAYLLFIVLISFIAIAMKAFTSGQELILMLKGLIPQLPPDAAGTTAEGEPITRSSLIFFAGIVGGGVAATAILSYPYFMMEGNYTKEKIKSYLGNHVIIYGLIFGIYSFVLLIAGGYALNGSQGYVGFQGPAEMGMALHDVWGPAGAIFFSLGLFICAYTTLIVVSQLCSYFILDAIGKEWRFSKSNTLYMIPFLGYILLPAVLSPFWNYANMLKVVIGMVFNSLINPLSIILLLYLANKKSLMQDLKASALRNVFLLYTLILILFTGTLGFIGFWNNFSAIFK